MSGKKSEKSGTNEDTSCEDEFVPPDGGWGWIVVFSSFMIHVIADGVTYTFGIFYTEFLKYFNDSKGTTAWVTSIMVGTTFCIGPIASGLTNRYGCRRVTIIGSILASFGLLLSIFAPNVIYLYFTIGLCTGAGFGLMYLPAIVCVTCYFEKKRAFATGIAVCGSGIGTFALAPFVEFLVDRYGWKGAMLIVTGIVLNCCIFGGLFRPLEMKSKKQKQPMKSVLIMKENPHLSLENGIFKGDKTNLEVRRIRAISFPSHSMSDLMPNHPLLMQIAKEECVSERRRMSDSTPHKETGSNKNLQCNGESPHIGPLYRKDIFYSGSLLNIPEYRSNPNLYHSQIISIPKQETTEIAKSTLTKLFGCSKEMQDTFKEMMDFHLMKNIIFLMFGFSNFFTNIGFNVPYVYSKDRALETGIAGNEDASFLLSIIGIANTLGRVLLGYLSDKPWVNRLWLYNSCLTICGLSTSLSFLCTDYKSMAVYSIVFGATAGAYVSLTSVILVDLLGLDKLTNAFGLLLVFEGIACLVGPPITGWLYDWTGSYDPGYHVSGAMIAVSGLMLFGIPFIKRCQARYSQKSSQEEFVQNGEIAKTFS
ncbi:monocarboxylate transporter 12-like [Centruroides vittatus]|uniref:monocarboxylate transporter 12-like n=1 Tax=Centruroides vittatus TaxID=120091 RepID=UPI00350F488D